MKKVIFIDSVHPVLWERLEEMGFICDDFTSKSKEEVLANISEYTGAVIRSKFIINNSVLEKASRLKFIARSGAGLENIDLDACKTKGVKVYNSPEGNRTAVGEQAMGMLLSLFNNLNRADQQVRTGIWDREGNRGHELSGKTVGIIGFGNMGSAFAQRLQGFECKILAYDKYKTNYAPEYVEETSLEEIFSKADVLSIHLPYNDETAWYINAAFISKFKKPIYVINTSRGKQLKVADLLKAIDSGKVLGACLDVLEFEKTSFENLNKDELPAEFGLLVESDKVILAPHIAGWTYESYIKLSSFLAQKIEKDLKHYLE